MKNKQKNIIGALILLLIIGVVSAEDVAETAICIPDWTCTAWSLCITDYQNRTCTDTKFCGNEPEYFKSKPAEFKECDVSTETSDIVPDREIIRFGINTCSEIWKCAPWSVCTGGKQTRKCFDENACETELKKPIIEQSCAGALTVAEQSTPPIPENPDSTLMYIYILGSLIIIGGLGFAGYVYLNKRTISVLIPKTDSVLDNYITKMKIAGFTSAQIKNELIKSGYDPGTINKYFPMHNPELKKFTLQMLSEGYNPLQIGDHLIVYGYSPEQIKEHFEHINMGEINENN
ncbi:hypothetical protein J4418_00330 [Candidatus Woesearchaeota archaeon]|nr:hypothetical protein [Candidatus Woesearchaeota archaeon]